MRRIEIGKDRAANVNVICNTYRYADGAKPGLSGRRTKWSIERDADVIDVIEAVAVVGTRAMIVGGTCGRHKSLESWR